MVDIYDENMFCPIRTACGRHIQIVTQTEPQNHIQFDDQRQNCYLILIDCLRMKWHDNVIAEEIRLRTHKCRAMHWNQPAKSKLENWNLKSLFRFLFLLFFLRLIECK